MLTFSTVELFSLSYLSEACYEDEDEGFDTRFIASILIICVNFLTRTAPAPPWHRLLT